MRCSCKVVHSHICCSRWHIQTEPERVMMNDGCQHSKFSINVSLYLSLYRPVIVYVCVFCCAWLILFDHAFVWWFSHDWHIDTWHWITANTLLILVNFNRLCTKCLTIYYFIEMNFTIIHGKTCMELTFIMSFLPSTIVFSREILMVSWIYCSSYPKLIRRITF